MRGKPSWWDILVDDLEVAQRFYRAVFGWTFPIPGPDFVVVFDGTEQVGQLYASSEQVSGRGIRMYFDTDDLEAILAKVASAGGIVKTERTPIGPEMGWYGEFTDPSGVTIGLHTSVPAK
jgi:predicted enzyme related to lactoylglutathione lyase